MFLSWYQDKLDDSNFMGQEKFSKLKIFESLNYQYYGSIRTSNCLNWSLESKLCSKVAKWPRSEKKSNIRRQVICFKGAT